MLNPEHVHDAASRSLDPTGTARLRRSFRADLSRRWQMARIDVLRTVGSIDAFGLQRGGQDQISALASGAAPLDAFRNWFEGLVRKEVMGQSIERYVEQGYFAGAQRAEKMVQFRNPYPINTAALVLAATAELEGIVQAVIQQAMRAMTAGMASRERPMKVARMIAGRIDAIGIERSKSLANVAIVQAHANATLDLLKLAGVTHVGIVPEHQPRARVADAARKPTARQIGTLLRRERKLEKLGKVNVLTAEDDDVCLKCEKISESGPYQIDSARQLIPAHPNCRCAFEPA